VAAFVEPPWRGEMAHEESLQRMGPMGLMGLIGPPRPLTSHCLLLAAYCLLLTAHALAHRPRFHAAWLPLQGGDLVGDSVDLGLGQ
jgi:hypothetical protein